MTSKSDNGRFFDSNPLYGLSRPSNSFNEAFAGNMPTTIKVVDATDDEKTEMNKWRYVLSILYIILCVNLIISAAMAMYFDHLPWGNIFAAVYVILLALLIFTFELSHGVCYVLHK